MERVNWWDVLPEECKTMILSRLSIKEVARIARVSKELLRVVNVLRSSVQLLVLPPTLSASALEGMVAAHPNIKSLSFKRCGAKLKTFVPIIKAAATGYVTVVENDRFDSAITREKQKVRSLTSISFRNCVNLVDTDVSILCSLHSRLEEVDLTNCPFVTDIVLLTLSRYQHAPKPSDPLERYNCYPRVFDKASKATSDTFTESEEIFLRDNDAAVLEEILGLGLNSNNSRSWPRTNERARKEYSSGHPQYSSRKFEEGKILAASSNSSSNSSLSRRDSNAGVNSNSNSNMGMKKSYHAPMLAKPVHVVEKPISCSVDLELEKSTTTSHNLQSVEPAELDLSLPFIQRIDPCGVQPSNAAHLDPSLTFIDWNQYDLDKTAKYVPQTLGDERLLSGTDYCSTSGSSQMLVFDDTSHNEIAATNRYRDMYKHYLIDNVEDSSCALPDLIDKLRLTTFNAKDLSQAHYRPTLVQTNHSGSKYNTLETLISDNQMMRTQTSLFIPNLPFGTVNENGQSKQKTICVANAMEIRDQRVQLDPFQNEGRMTPKGTSEAFCRTINHVGIFAVPNADLKLELPDADQICEGMSNNNDLENNGLSRTSGETKKSSQLAICLPDATNIGGMLRRNQQPMQPSDGCAESIAGSDESVETELHLDLEIDKSRYSPGLRKVCVANCPEISDRGVQALLKGTSRTCLSTLDVSRCGGVTNGGLKLPGRSGLQHLIAVQMPTISRLVFQLPIQSVLQHMNLAGCHKLEELVLVTPSLKTLNLSNCKKLARLLLRCPLLTTLNLSLCEGLERFVKFQCSGLQSLNVMSCRALLQSTLNAMVDSSPNLEHLRCGGCECVERLDLLHSGLLTLEVSGNQSLKRLFCQSRVLRVVDACGCKHLVEVYLYSPYLRRMLFANCALLQVLVIPLDSIKETMDIAASQNIKVSSPIPDELEISISGCNMPEMVKKNLAKLSKQWHSCFKSST